MITADRNEISFGNQIPVYEVISGSLVAFNDADYYPILEGDNIIATYGIHYLENGEHTTTIDTGWVQSLNSVYSNSESICAVVVNNQVFFKSRESVVLVAEYDLELFSDSYSTNLYQSVFSETDIEKMSGDDLEYSNLRIINNIDMSTVKQSSSAVAALPDSSKTLNMTYYFEGRQRHEATCWAHCVAMITGYYHKEQWRNWFSPEEICDQMGWDYDVPSTPENTMSAFDYYGVPVTHINALTETGISDAIRSYKPFYMRWISTDGLIGHGTVCSSYSIRNANNKMYIVIYDSGSGNRTQLSKDLGTSTTNFAYTLGGIRIRYNKTYLPQSSSPNKE